MWDQILFYMLNWQFFCFFYNWHKNTIFCCFLIYSINNKINYRNGRVVSSTEDIRVQSNTSAAAWRHIYFLQYLTQHWDWIEFLRLPVFDHNGACLHLKEVFGIKTNREIGEKFPSRAHLYHQKSGTVKTGFLPLTGDLSWWVHSYLQRWLIGESEKLSPKDFCTQPPWAWAGAPVHIPRGDELRHPASFLLTAARARWSAT